MTHSLHAETFLPIRGVHQHRALGWGPNILVHLLIQFHYLGLLSRSIKPIHWLYYSPIYLVWSVNIQCDSKKYSPKTFCNIFTRAKYISVKFCWLVASLYIYILTNFGQFILIFNKMAFQIFIGVLTVFNRFKFRVSSPLMSGPSLPDLKSMDYQVWGNAGVLSQAATEANNSFWVWKCTSVDLICLKLYWRNHCNWQLYERQPQSTAGMCAVLSKVDDFATFKKVEVHAENSTF